MAPPTWALLLLNVVLVTTINSATDAYMAEPENKIPANPVFHH